MEIINYFLSTLFVLKVLHLEICGICFLASFGGEKRVPSFFSISLNLFTADFLSLAKNVPISNQENQYLNNLWFNSCRRNLK
tara:strand:+ start:554 stop:799 length:246 start_codon:yes stop_codon:yes gene_type:complete